LATIYGPSARLIWSLTSSGLGTALAAGGNSGPWTPTSPNAVTTVDLRDVTDVLLAVTVTGTVTGTTPTLSVQLNGFDDLGNVLAGLVKLSSNLTAAGSATASGGLHTSSLVLPAWGQIAWSVGGTSPVFPGVEICVYGR
jgi:hypothetical protein